MPAGPIENIIFDLGNVLIHCDLEYAAREISKMAARPEEEIRHLLEKDTLIAEFDEGRHSADEFVDRMRDLTGWSGSREALERIWQEMLSADPEMFEYLDDLISRGYKTYILSNINPYHVGHVKETYPKVLSTHGQIFSCECRMIKPDERIFHHTRDTLGIEPERSIFIDDRQPNIQSAELVGFIGIHHLSNQDTKEKIEALLRS